MLEEEHFNSTQQHIIDSLTKQIQKQNEALIKKAQKNYVYGVYGHLFINDLEQNSHKKTL